MKHIQLYNSCKIAYTDEGNGAETLVFVHGLGAFGSTWQKNIDSLKKDFRCIAIDLPGNGHSETGDFHYTIAFYADCLLDFIGRSGLKKVTLVGHSMGGQVAVTAILKQPLCCEKLILISPAGFETFTGHERMMYDASLKYLSMITTNEQAIQHLVHTSFYRFPDDALRFEKQLIQLMKAQPAGRYKRMSERSMAAMLNEPIFSKLSAIQQPTLVIFGENDTLIPNPLLHPGSTRKVAETGTKQIPNARLEMVKNAGHFVQWESAERVNEIIRRFDLRPGTAS